MPAEPTPAADHEPDEHGGLPATPGADERAAARQHDEEVVDEAGDESFPASDPPSYTPTHAGTPDPVR